MSGKLKQIGSASDATLGKFSGLEGRTGRVDAKFRQAGVSATALSGKLKLLGADAMRSIPGLSLLMNPIVAAGTAITVMTGQALKFDQGMAKINTTAQLSQDELAGLKTKILDVGKAIGADPGQLTTTFEKILSQVGDVDVSMKIFKATLRGAKGGFTDAAVVADALANSVSAIGANNVEAEHVLDVLNAAKRVGAGEFADYARYVPGLIADARNLGIAFEDTAGLFAYMTAKGNSAEKSAVYMQNAFTALSKSEIQVGLKNEGIDIFDKDGATKNIADIMEMIGTKINGLGDKDRINFLEKIGLRDAQAKTAISILSADAEKLRKTLYETANAAGETDAAIALSANPLQRLTDLWNKFKITTLQAADVLLVLLDPLTTVAGVLLNVISPVLLAISSSILWVTQGLKDGNPFIWGAVSALTAYAAITGFAAVGTMGLSAVFKIAALATGGWTAAMTFLNAAFIASPIGWIVLGIGAVVAGVMYAWNTFDGFRETVFGLWDAFKQVLTNIGDFFTKIFSPIFEAIDAFKEGRWGDAAIAVGKAAFNLSPVGMVVEGVKFAADGGFTKGVGDAFAKGKTNAAEKAVKELAGMPVVPGAPAAPGNGGKTNSPATTTTAEAIATGGSKTQNFNISIGSLVDKMNIHNGDNSLGVDDIKDKVLDALMRAINMSQSLANG